MIWKAGGKEDTHSQKNKHSVEVKILLNFYTPIIYRKSGIRSRVSNYFHEIFGQDLLSKKWVLLRLLFEGGFYLRAASNTGFTVFAKLKWKDTVKLLFAPAIQLIFVYFMKPILLTIFIRLTNAAGTIKGRLQIISTWNVENEIMNDARWYFLRYKKSWIDQLKLI